METGIIESLYGIEKWLFTPNHLLVVGVILFILVSVYIYKRITAGKGSEMEQENRSPKAMIIIKSLVLAGNIVLLILYFMRIMMKMIEMIETGFTI